ncbi:aminoglycoside adenylyltransferase family protein [Nonomuraea wenchangensis]
MCCTAGNRPKRPGTQRRIACRACSTARHTGVMKQLEQTVGLVRDVAGAELLGTYLHGSAVFGRLAPASDLDVLAVTRRSLDHRRRSALVEGLLEISGCTPTVRPVELTVVVQSEVRPWRFPPTGDFLFGEWLRDELQSGGPPRPGPMPDLALLLTVALAGARPLTGPPLAGLLDPVPRADLARASVAAIPELLAELNDDTRNVLLTLARIWVTLATGEITSKDAAADWALARLPPRHRPVLEHARNLYLTCHYQDEVWDDGLKTQVRPHVDEVLSRIDHLRSQS